MSIKKKIVIICIIVLILLLIGAGVLFFVLRQTNNVGEGSNFLGEITNKDTLSFANVSYNVIVGKDDITDVTAVTKSGDLYKYNVENDKLEKDEGIPFKIKYKMQGLYIDQNDSLYVDYDYYSYTKYKEDHEVRFEKLLDNVVNINNTASFNVILDKNGDVYFYNKTPILDGVALSHGLTQRYDKPVKVATNAKDICAADYYIGYINNNNEFYAVFNEGTTFQKILDNVKDVDGNYLLLNNGNLYYLQYAETIADFQGEEFEKQLRASNVESMHTSTLNNFSSLTNCNYYIKENKINLINYNYGIKFCDEGTFTLKICEPKDLKNIIHSGENKFVYSDNSDKVHLFNINEEDTITETVYDFNIDSIKKIADFINSK